MGLSWRWVLSTSETRQESTFKTRCGCRVRNATDPRLSKPTRGNLVGDTSLDEVKLLLEMVEAHTLNSFNAAIEAANEVEFRIVELELAKKLLYDVRMLLEC